MAAAGFAIGAAGCGFSPAYGPQGAGTPLTGALRADDPTNRDSFDFVAAIEARFGVAANPQFALSYLIAIREEYKISNRVHVIGVLDYTLTDIATGTALAAGRVENFVAYSSVTGSTARVVSLPKTVADARARLVSILADQAGLELIGAMAAIPDR